MKEKLIRCIKLYVYRRNMEKVRNSVMNVDRLMRSSFSKKHLQQELSSKEILILKNMQSSVIECIDKNKENINTNIKIKNNEFWSYYNKYKQIEIKDTNSGFEVYCMTKDIVFRIKDGGVLWGFGVKEITFVALIVIFIAYILPNLL